MPGGLMPCPCLLTLSDRRQNVTCNQEDMQVPVPLVSRPDLMLVTELISWNIILFLCVRNNWLSVSCLLYWYYWIKMLAESCISQGIRHWKRGLTALLPQKLVSGLCHEGESENGGLSRIRHAGRGNVRNFVDNACNLLKLLLLVGLYRMSQSALMCWFSLKILPVLWWADVDIGDKILILRFICGD